MATLQDIRARSTEDFLSTLYNIPAPATQQRTVHLVRLAATANMGLSGLDTTDGVTPVAGDAILLAVQTDPTENGLWIASAGSWTRAAVAIAAGDLVVSEEGSAFAGSLWECLSIDSDEPAFALRSILQASATLNFGATLAAGAVEDRTITVTGAAVTDVATASPNDDPGTTAGVVWSARVSAADTVTVRLANPTGGTITLVNRTWRAAVTHL